MRGAAAGVIGWLLLGAPRAEAAPERTIGMVVDGLGYDQDGLRAELVRVLSADFDVSIPADKVLVAGWSLPVAEVQLDSLLADPEVDLVVALGVLSSHVAAHRTAPGKPIVAPYVIDPVMQGLTGPRDPQVAWLVYPNTVDADLRALYAVTPFQHVAAIVHQPFLQVLTELPDAGPVSRELGFTISIVPVDGHPRAALDALPPGVDAVLLTPLPGVPMPAVTELAAALVERGLPSAAQNGRPEVVEGMLLGLTDGRESQRQTRQAALVAEELLRGRDPGSLLDPRQPSLRTTLNLTTAEALGVVPSLEVLFDAEVLGEGTTGLSLHDAIALAREHHAGLAGAREQMAAADEARARATAMWLPSVTSSLGVEVIDSGRVDASLGTLAHTTTTLGARVDQLVFSDAALANLSIQGDAAGGRASSLEALEADLVLEVSLAWANLHRARARVGVHAGNVAQVDAHLAAGRSQRAVGQRSGAELARWEAELAQAKRLLVDARTLERRAALALERLVGEPVELSPSTLVDPETLPTGIDERVLDALLSADRAVAERVADRLVAIGVADAPELDEVDARIAGQERLLTVARRAWAVPEVGVSASVAEIGRLGYDPLRLPGLPRGTFPKQPSTIWTVGASATLPLYAGGGRDADRREATSLLAALEHQRRFTEEGVELRIRDTLTAAAGSYAGRLLASEARVAADRNAEWAAQAYAQGALPQVGLIDARTAARDASLAYADASFVLLGDLLHLQRAVMHQHAVIDDGAWAAFLADIASAVGSP